MVCILIALVLGTFVGRFCTEKMLLVFSGCLFLTFASMEIFRLTTRLNASEA